MEDDTPYVALLKEGGRYEPRPVDITEPVLVQMTRFAYYPLDWLRFAQMELGGAPALMRAAKPPDGWKVGEPLWNRGDTPPAVQWMYVLKKDDLPAGNTTFSTIEAKQGQLTKLLGETAP
jgi:hypothetical protein